MAKVLTLEGLMIVTRKIKDMLDTKVDREQGKVLSDNNYSNEDKNKLNSLSESTTENVIEKIKVNNIELIPTNKTVNIDLSNYLTEDAAESYIDSAISTAINETKSFEVKVVSSLPATGDSTVLYVMANGGSESGNSFTEYLWIQNKYEILGGTNIDFSDYASVDYVDDELSIIKQQLIDLTYEEIQISSFTNNQSVAEKGSTVINPVFNWVLNKQAIEVMLDTTEISPQLTSFTYIGSLTANKTFTLKATDEKNYTASKTCAVSFYNGIYWSVFEESEKNLTSSFSSWSKTLSDTKNRSFTVDAGTTKYIYYAYPDRLGNVSFSVGGFSGGFSLIGTETFTNPSGFAELYRIYRSDNKGLGNTTVVVANN